MAKKETFKEYDFAKMQGKPNPYAKLLKKRKITWAELYS